MNNVEFLALALRTSFFKTVNKDNQVLKIVSLNRVDCTNLAYFISQFSSYV